ncbi:hypothetical protein PR202_gb03108 [Eleusine coracana subsp. coracana]|uniref:Uncharacterized protein n=1 Tax=Eleusine coracana subsp. coracana TaxID=191504 RepID=A0AAV5E212_ELECO|nr:hypothetical protein PR202_gb03108 [Eleusine coracana subsp. coracana]
MGFKEEHRPSWGLGGLYRVQIADRPLYSDEEAAKTSIVDTSTSELQEGVGLSRSFQIRRLWQQRPPCLKPIHCSLSCDKHVGETIANVITSLPFIALGLQAPRRVSFAQRASMDPELKMAHNLHKMSSLLGGALFVADDVSLRLPTSMQHGI